MRMRVNLWEGPTPSLNELAEVLLELAQSSDWSTLLVKGKWGVGKTSAVRSLMDSPAMQEIGKKYAYISLAGATSVVDESTLFRLTRS
jgi:hypothetical protein